jgi:hypothetical protein
MWCRSLRSNGDRQRLDASRWLRRRLTLTPLYGPLATTGRASSVNPGAAEAGSHSCSDSRPAPPPAPRSPGSTFYAGQLLSFFSVSGPTMPSTSSSFAFWNALRAARVFSQHAIRGPGVEAVHVELSLYPSGTSSPWVSSLSTLVSPLRRSERWKPGITPTWGPAPSARLSS